MIHMFLYDLLLYVNDGMRVHLYDGNQGDLGVYEGKEEIPAYHEDCLVNDIFGESATTIGIEIETEEEEWV